MNVKQFGYYGSLLSVCSALIYSSLLLAAEPVSESPDLNLCPSSNSSLEHIAPPVFEPEDIENINVSAEQVQNMSGSTSIFTGNVSIERHLLRLRADEVLHDKSNQRLELTGNIHADTEGMALSADSGWLNLQTSEGELLNSVYYMPEAHLTGKTPVFALSADEKTILLDSQISTCPVDKFDWHLNTSWLELDRATDTGTAKHTVLWLKGIPVIYIPWIQFPLGDARRSGFLMPNIGTSSRSGFEMSIPWYWNIAPNQDAIITPAYLRDRGSMLSTDYRYLTQSSRGNIQLEYIDKDLELDQDRHLYQLYNQSKITNNLSLGLLANDISDADYLRDISSNINSANTSHLENNANLKYTAGSWNAGLLAQTYETIDLNILSTDRPYRRLPQLTLNGSEQLIDMDKGYLTASLTSEWVDFKHEESNKPQGSRLHINPRLSLPIKSSAWFITPSAGFMHTQYDTTDTNGDSIELESRNLSTFSLDSGLLFERHLTDSSVVQTLEPRLFYLNIPYEDQSSIPIFDTSAQDFSFASLFRENRFNGIDRVGDANQLTAAISSRLLDRSNGEELLNLSLGRIFYYDDRQVSLTDDIETTTSSDIITELSGTLNRWRARATYQWNTETDTSDKRSIQFNYAASEHAVFNIGYRLYRDPADEINNIEQTDVSFAWPFAKNYSLLSRWNYSLIEKRDIDTLVGIEYESCCWALRLVSQRYITTDTDDAYDTSIMLQFVLKGFGSIADKKATDTLKNAILGYQPDY